MNQARPARRDDHAWEKEHAPTISTTQWYLVAGVFSLWVAFLVAMSIHRWVVTLQ